MRSLIDRYTLDNRRPPESLDELVQAGYLKGGLPVDPFTGSNQTWQPEMEDVSSVLGHSLPRREADLIRELIKVEQALYLRLDTAIFGIMAG